MGGMGPMGMGMGMGPMSMMMGPWGMGGWGPMMKGKGKGKAMMMNAMMMKGAMKGDWGMGWGMDDGWGADDGASGYGKGKGKGGPSTRGAPYVAAAEHMAPATKDEVLAFIKDNELQSKVHDELFALGPKLQAVIINQPLTDARDRTAVVITRINNLYQMKQGDWICPGCADIQFAVNAKCRKCGHKCPNGPSESQLQMMEPAAPELVEQFIEQNGILDKGANKLRALDERLQTLVMSQSLDDARDKTAVVITRVDHITRMKPTDWICPACLDIQFAQNK